MLVVRSVRNLGARLDGSLARHLASSTSTRAPASDSLLRLQFLESDADHSSARNWLDGFGVDDIPKDAWEAGYSRSSGPGGQVSTFTRLGA